MVSDKSQHFIQAETPASTSGSLTYFASVGVDSPKSRCSTLVERVHFQGTDSSISLQRELKKYRQN